MFETVNVLLTCRCGAEADVRVYAHEAESVMRGWLIGHAYHHRDRPKCLPMATKQHTPLTPQLSPAGLAWVNRTLAQVDAWIAGRK